MESRSSSTRLLIVAAVLALWTGASLVRLAYLQLFRYADFLARAERQQQHIVEISPKRADILDRNLHELAMSASVNSCFAVPSEIADPHMVAQAARRRPGRLARRDGSAPGLLALLRVDRPQAASGNRRRAFRRSICEESIFSAEDQRFYPKRDLAAPVLGLRGHRREGHWRHRVRSSTTASAASPGRMLILADAHSRWYDSSDKTPDAGSSVVLTIDENIQFIAEKELAAAIAADPGSKAGTVIVQDPSNGEILAMASWPTFNPNAPGGSTPEARMNRAVGALYEPGSVFKIVTLSAAIDQGITTPDEVVDCQMGAIYIAGHRIRDHQPFGLLTVSADSGEFERRRRHQDRPAAGRAEVLRLHSRVRFRQPDGTSICPAKTAVCCAGSKIGRRFRSARSPWARKSA